MRKAADDATRHIRKNKALMRSLKTPLFDLGARVGVRLRLSKHKVPKKTWALMGHVLVDCRQAKHRYKVSFKQPNENRREQWFHVSELASAQTHNTTPNKRSHRSKFYIPLTREGSAQNMVTECGLPISYNPPGDGNCQFAAMAHHLETLGIHRSARTLRHEVTQYLDTHVALGSSEHAVPWDSFIEESRMQYLRRMNNLATTSHCRLCSGRSRGRAQGARAPSFGIPKNHKDNLKGSLLKK